MLSTINNQNLYQTLYLNFSTISSFPKIIPRDANLSKTQNYHPSQQKSSKFPPKRYENQEKTRQVRFIG